MNVILSLKSMISTIHIADLLTNIFIENFAISSIWSHNQIIKYLYAWCGDCFSDFVSIGYSREFVINKSKIASFSSHAKKLKIFKFLGLFVCKSEGEMMAANIFDCHELKQLRNCPFRSNSNSFRYIFTNFYSTISASSGSKRCAKSFFCGDFVFRTRICL
jgi:hypothetical protein